MEYKHYYFQVNKFIYVMKSNYPVLHPYGSLVPTKGLHEQALEKIPMGLAG